MCWSCAAGSHVPWLGRPPEHLRRARARPQRGVGGKRPGRAGGLGVTQRVQGERDPGGPSRPALDHALPGVRRWRRKGDTALFVRDFDDLESRIVSGSEGASSFFWSPDGRSLAFFAGSQLKRVDVAGGSATVICEAPTGNRGGAWTPGGVILFGSTLGLQQVPATGGTPVTALALAADEVIPQRCLVLLPDGEQPAGRRRCWQRNPRPARAEDGDSPGLVRASRAVRHRSVRATGRVRRRTVDLRSRHQPAGATLRRRQLAAERRSRAARRSRELVPNLPYGYVSAAGSALAYVPATNPNVHQLTWFDRAGRQTALLGEPGNYSSLELSPDQTRAVVAVMDPARRNHDIWVFDVARALRTRFDLRAWRRADGDLVTGAATA